MLTAHHLGKSQSERIVWLGPLCRGASDHASRLPARDTQLPSQLLQTSLNPALVGTYEGVASLSLASRHVQARRAYDWQVRP